MVTDLTANLRQQPSGGPVMLPGTHAACPRPFSTASSFPKPLTHPPTFSLSADDLASCFTGKLNQTEENPIEPQYHMDLPNAAPTHSDPLPGIRGILCALKPHGRQSPHLREDIVSAICHVSSAFYFLLPIPRHVSWLLNSFPHTSHHTILLLLFTAKFLQEISLLSSPIPLLTSSFNITTLSLSALWFHAALAVKIQCPPCCLIPCSDPGSSSY